MTVITFGLADRIWKFALESITPRWYFLYKLKYPLVMAKWGVSFCEVCWDIFLKSKSKNHSSSRIRSWPHWISGNTIVSWSVAFSEDSLDDRTASWKFRRLVSAGSSMSWGWTSADHTQSYGAHPSFVSLREGRSWKLKLEICCRKLKQYCAIVGDSKCR